MPIILRPDTREGVGVAFSSDVGRPNAEGADGARSRQRATLTGVGLPAGAPFVVVHQIHSAVVHHVDETFLARVTPAEGDAMVTTLPGVVLCARGADCLPVAFTSSNGVVGAAHAGRVGFLRGVLDATVVRMRELGARDIEAWIGPHICGGCYEVPESLRTDVSASHPAAFATTSWGTPAVDIGAGALARFAELSVAVRDAGVCTYENPAWHSARRVGNDAYGSNGACVWINPQTM